MAERSTDTRAARRPGIEPGGSSVAGPHHSHLTALSNTLNAAPTVGRLAAAAPPPRAGRTGLPHALKDGIETLSGVSLDDVNVHYGSAKPAQLNADAFAQGAEIHLASGQERHLPHEAWHVVQQAQGRVKPTTRMGDGIPVNDDKGLEQEADMMGARAATAVAQRRERGTAMPPFSRTVTTGSTPTVQRALTSFDSIAASATSKKFRWARLRTNTDDDDAQSEGKASGLGVNTTSGKKLKSKITWQPVDGQSEEASGVDAEILGPDHRLGSEPQTGRGKIWNKRRIALSKAAGDTKYIAGHLLNNNLGGPGDDARNLTAIPATANATQSSGIEEEVKKLVNVDYRFLHYKVDVEYERDNAGKRLYFASKITSRWNALDEDGNEIAPNKTVTINIPSPSSLAADEEVTVAGDDDVKDFSVAAQADVDPIKDIVLNNSGYLKIATTVQQTFAASIKALREELESTRESVVRTEEERDINLEKIEELEDELTENNELLDATQAELTETLARLAQTEEENVELKSNIEQLKGAYEQSKKEIISLRKSVKKYKKKISDLRIENAQIRVAHAASQDLLGLGGAVPEENLDGLLLVSRIQAGLERAKESASKSDQKFQAFLRRRNADKDK